MASVADKSRLLAAMAETHLSAGRAAEAAAAFTRAINAAIHLGSVDRAALHARQGWALHEAGEMAAAEAAYRCAAELDPDNLSALLALAELTFRQRRFDELERWAAEVLRARPREPHGLYYLGRVRMEQGDWPGACAAFEGTLAALPDHRSARAHLSVALQYAGRREEAARILDYARLVVAEEVMQASGYLSIAAFNAALAAGIRACASLLRDRPNRATIGGSQTDEFLSGPEPVVATLRSLIQRAVERRLTEAVPRDGFGVAANQGWDLRGWAVVLPAGGYQDQHFHPSGIVSGIYYVDVPPQIHADDASHAGHLIFGRSKPKEEAGEQAQFLTYSVAPRPGLLVTFPSHFWHHTEPFSGAGERLCVAFDARLAPGDIAKTRGVL